MAQRARRDRERISKQSAAYQLGQRLQGASLIANRRHPTCLEKRTNSTNVTAPAQKRQMVTHTSTFTFSSPSTSAAPQMNW